ncbi:hypothetical protein TRVL_06676 [Trypanosoma vivax]|nr:hypothetical protein TRVL_06676 [Trypanosoma vivax]
MRRRERKAATKDAPKHLQRRSGLMIASPQTTVRAKAPFNTRGGRAEQLTTRRCYRQRAKGRNTHTERSQRNAEKRTVSYIRCPFITGAPKTAMKWFLKVVCSQLLANRFSKREASGGFC